MIGLDTNVLVRYLVEDDAPQTAAAAELINGLTDDEPGFISLVTVVELLWVLHRVYRVPEQQGLAYLDGFLSAEEVRVERPDLVRLARHDATSTSSDFSDALIGRIGVANGCTTTYTFDRRAARGLAAMTLIRE